MIQQQLAFHQNVFGYQALLQHISYIQQKKEDQLEYQLII